jgi:manganese/zinc/iron transport system substrate-binding protein
MSRAILFLLLVCAMFGCKSADREAAFCTEKGALKVLSTTAMIGDIVQQIGGERIAHDTLILGEIDPHSYELVKGDDEKIESADIVFFNGLHLEHGASLLYKIKAHPCAKALGDLVFAKYPEEMLFENGQVDPHIWMDVFLWTKIIQPIVETLSKFDPEGSLYYEDRAKNLEQKMLCFHESLLKKLQQVPESRRYLVTSHDAFGYFARRYLADTQEQQTGDWKKRFAAPEGLAPDGQLGFIDLQEIIRHLLLYNIEVVFSESNLSRDSLKKIVFACKEKKVCVRFSQDALYGDCMGKSGSYLDMIEHNRAVLMREWQ